jgi:phenylpropionate dioxygenase-like ring-hydroxylating dioxygenase large terminal subunit
MKMVNVAEKPVNSDVRNVGKRGITRHVNPLPNEGEDGLFTQSWFPICFSEEVRPGEVLGKPFLDGRVVIFRGENGKVNVTSAYCPHVGADLAVGQVVGNNIQCAFHGWEYDETGQCTKAFPGQNPPPKACLFAYPVTERYGLVWVFNGEEPLWEIPTFDQKNEEDLVIRTFKHEPAYECDPWVFCCNTLDFQHLITMHGIDVPREALKSALHKEVRWNEWGFDYDVSTEHQGGISLDWKLGIRGTTIYRQQGMYDGFWFGYMAVFEMPKPGQHIVYNIFAVEKVDDTPEGRALEEQRLKIASDLEVRTIEEDRDVLDSIRMAPGHLLNVDKSLGKFYEFLRKYPRAHPGADFIK